MSKMMSIPGLLLTVASVVAAAKNEKMVKFVTVLYRHGDRTPIKPYPTDPYRNESYWYVIGRVVTTVTEIALMCIFLVLYNAGPSDSDS